jgi:hypothetical protein
MSLNADIEARHRSGGGPSDPDAPAGANGLRTPNLIALAITALAVVLASSIAVALFLG